MRARRRPPAALLLDLGPLVWIGAVAFTAVYGLAWLAGSAALGALDGYAIEAAIVFTVAIEALALATFLPVAFERRNAPSATASSRDTP